MECKDKNCPTHGTLSARGIVLDGEVVSDKMEGTVIVRRDRFVKVRKYDRYRRSTSRLPAHNPPCVNARTGDLVKIMECRKLSKTVSFVIVEKMSKVGETNETPKKVKAKSKAKEVVNG